MQKSVKNKANFLRFLSDSAEISYLSEVEFLPYNIKSIENRHPCDKIKLMKSSVVN